MERQELKVIIFEIDKQWQAVLDKPFSEYFAFFDLMQLFQAIWLQKKCFKIVFRL